MRRFHFASSNGLVQRELKTEMMSEMKTPG